MLKKPPGEIPLAPLVIPSSNLLRGFVGQTRGPHGDSGQRKLSEHVFPYDEPGVREIHFASGAYLRVEGEDFFS